MGNKIELFWWRGKQNRNFGDVLSPSIVSCLLDKSVVHSEFGDNKLVAIGSLLQTNNITNNNIIWGTGFIGAGTCIPNRPKNLTFLAVRGPKTRNLVIQAGYDCPEIYGDPAILIDEYIEKNKKKIDKIFNNINNSKVGVIPHYVDYEIAVKQMKNHSFVKVIDILSPIDKIIAEIKSCDRIFSSSLHGIIVAEALKKPTARFSYGKERLAGGDFKFEDYYLSTQREESQPCLMWSHEIDWVSAFNELNNISKPVFEKEILKKQLINYKDAL
jgi:pyruvyltransferase